MSYVCPGPTAYASLQELALFAWSHAKVGLLRRCTHHLIGEASLPRLHAFKPLELTALVHSFGAARCPGDDAFMNALFDVLRARQGEFSEGARDQIARALRLVGRCHPPEFHTLTTDWQSNYDWN